MLTRLLPEQISTHWDIIKYAIEQSLPPIVGDHPDKLNRLLSSALSGKLEVWASYTRGKETKFEAVLVTKILYDDASDTRNLLLYCVYGYSDVPKESWINGFETILKYAKSKGCLQVVAYTTLPYMIELGNKLGGNSDYTFISFDVNRSLNNLTNFIGG